MTLASDLLSGKTFVVTELGGVELSNFRPVVTFNADGTINGQSVNNFHGTYTVAGGSVTVGPLATTRMMGVPEAQDVENALLSTLALPLNVAIRPNDVIRLAGHAASLSLVEGSGDEMDAESGDTITVTGNVVYRQRIALPENAEITVSIIDVSLADAPAPVLATQVIHGGQVPIPFELTLDLSTARANALLSIGARIESNGQLIWITDMVTPIDPSGDIDGVTLNVISVGSE
jgi:putative lipoprotein